MMRAAWMEKPDLVGGKFEPVTALRRSTHWVACQFGEHRRGCIVYQVNRYPFSHLVLLIEDI